MLSATKLYADFFGDFIIRNSSTNTLKATFELASIPFEGITSLGVNTTNRVDTIQNGWRFKMFFIQTGLPKDYPIVFAQKTIINALVLDLGHCSTYELVSTPDSGYGFALYKITIDITETGEHYVCYWNSLDSKYGKTNYNGYDYSRDFGFEYIGTRPLNNRVLLKEATLGTIYDSLSTSEQGKIFNPWKIIYGRTEPWEKKFYCRSTPFGISPQYIERGYNRSLILGTKIILDTVYNNTGLYDRRGYNTVDTNALGGRIGYLENFNYYYSHPPIGNATFEKGNTYTTPAWYYYDNNFHYGTKITAQSGDTLILKRKKTLWITGIKDRTNPFGPFFGDTMVFKSGSVRILDPSAEIMTTNGGQVFYEAGSTLIWDEHSCNFAGSGSGISFAGTHTITNGGFFVVDAGGTLTLQDNTTLTFDGASSVLEIRGTSNIKFGINSKLVFKNGASIRANGGNFSGINGASWGGLVFENSGLDSLHNCVFSNASTYLDFSQNSSTANEKKIITGNTFNSGKVKIHNSYNLYFSGNTFNSLTAGGYLLQMSHNLAVLGESVSNINITGNIFKGGAVQMDLDGYASSVTKYYIAGNTFYGLTNSPYGVCMLANKISGDFKNNTFIDNHYSTGIQLTNSNINFLNNTIRTTSNNNVYLQTSSSGNFAPVVINEQGGLAYTGGYNQMYYDNSNSQTGEHANIFNGLGNSFFVVLGHNCFNIQNITPNYHIYGYRNGPCIEDPIWVTYNYWSQSPPKTLITCEETPVEIITTPADQSCTNFSELSASDYIITYMGDGIYDSVKIVNAPSGDDAGLPNRPSAASYSVPADKLLYGLCVKHNKTRSYLLSSVKAKELIDNFGSSDYIYSALDELYMSYKGMDTISGNTNSLFSELQTYIESKMNQYNNNVRFVEKAYNIYLMCLVMKKQYASAISGYENIMNNHPDPVVRLTASWDRSAVVLLMGQGGSQSSLSFLRKQESRLSDRNPDRIARKIFKSSGEESENGTVSEKYSNEEKSLINERAVKFNPSTKTEFDEKISQDKALLLALNNDAPSNRTNIIPKRFTLHQNYPNPFNPTTNIKYDIPKDGFISLKVYDVLGKEIFSVNEFKKAGSHETVFDGSGFASGVYFYSIQAGPFTDTKKMVLIK